MIKLNVDLQRCDANGTCAALMPDVFRIDELGIPIPAGHVLGAKQAYFPSVPEGA